MPTITLNTGRTFVADPALSILDAARAQGIILEYSCRTGRCGLCKASVVSGETKILRSESESLSSQEARQGLVLTCCRAVIGDVVLDIEPLDRLAGIDIKTMPSRIVSAELAAPDIVKIVLKTPPASPMQFLAGQYIDVIVEGVRRSYSLANAPRADGLLELLIKRYPGGVLSSYWFERAKYGDLLRIEGPFGTFFLRDERHENIIFLATGTGIAPVKALLEELSANPHRAAQTSISVFWGNREAASFCWNPYSLGLDVSFYQLLSGDDVDWDGGRKYVQYAAIEEGFDPSHSAVYACGSSTMINSARAITLAHGLPSARFYSDAFVSSS